MTRWLLIFSFCSVGMAQTAPAPADWRFAHPDADLKLSVNVQSLLNSGLMAQALEQAKTTAGNNGAQIDLVMGILRTIDRVSVSARQRAPNDMDVLAQVSGSFDPQTIAAFFPSTGKSKVKVVGPHTLLIGEGDSFTQAAARMNRGEPRAASAGDLQQSDIWIEAGAGILKQQTGQQAALPFLQGIKGVALGLTLTASPQVDLVVTAADQAGAADMLKTFQQLALAAPAASPEAAAVKPEFRQDGSRVRVHITVPPELIAMARQRAASGGLNGSQLPPQLAPLLGILGGSSSAPSAAKPPAPAPAPQDGGKVVIYGLDGGPKEFPVKQQ